MINPSEVFVLVPDEMGGLAVVAVGDLYDRLSGGVTVWTKDLQEAVENTAIDMIPLDAAAIAKVAELNRTGDADVYWGRP